MTEEDREPHEDLDKENEKDMNLIKKAFRWGQHPIAERLICQHLFFSTSNSPKQVITHTCMAAQVLEGLKDRVEGVDYPLLKRISKVNEAFKNHSELKHSDGTVFQISWGLPRTEETYDNFIKIWASDATLNYYVNGIKRHLEPARRYVHSGNWLKCGYPLYTIRKSATQKEIDEFEEFMQRKNVNKTCPRCHRSISESDITWREATVMKPYPDWSFFFEASEWLTSSGFMELRNAFHSWALPICNMAKAFISAVVSPKTYDDVAKMFMSKTKKEGEKTYG